MAFKRHRYYYEMGYFRNRRWERGRMASRPAVQAALVQLADSGGLHNCDIQKWTAYLDADRFNDAVLHDEYVICKERALWKMRMFRWKRRSLDLAAQRLVNTATKGQATNRPFVFAVGDAGFPSTGRGELPAPTASLSKAFNRALERVSRTGRRVVVFSVDEYRTTMCCCTCGSPTTAPRVNYRARDGSRAEKASFRLRACTTCETTGKLRDRDVQAARNILKIAKTMYYGQPRPPYLCRS
jgi:hypothetical protein